MNQTNLQYQGKVKVKLLFKDKFIEIENHNEGLDPFRYLFAKFLTNEKISLQEMPMYIDLRDSEDISLLVNKAVINDRSFDEENNGTYKLYPVTFKSVIGYNNLQEPITNRSSNYILYLCSGDNKDLAKLNISGEILVNLGPGVEAIVEWIIYIKNEESTGT